MEVDLDQGPDADPGDHHGCTLNRTHRLRSLVPLRMTLIFSSWWQRSSCSVLEPIDWEQCDEESWWKTW
jgi:hypothetical protein